MNNNNDSNVNNNNCNNNSGLDPCPSPNSNSDSNKNNKYDDFLKALDNSTINNNSNINNKGIDHLSPSDLYNKEKLDELIRIFDAQFIHKNLNSPQISGWDDTDNENSKRKYINPNLFNNHIDITHVKKRTRPKAPTLTVPKKKVIIDVDINSVADLIKLINDNPLDDLIEYNINMVALHKIKAPLTDLNDMIGLKNIKENILDQILYFIQDLHKTGNGEGDFMHTVIYGPPGTGKTEVAKIMGKIYSKLGILKNGTFKKVTRSDLIAGYLGQTAIKTAAVIAEALGGVLFIDEAYALGNSEKKDSFSKECIDTLCEALSNHKSELMVIIAGYESELNECFFSYNQGLESRFTWRFKTDEYKGEELYNIFLKKVHDCGWTLENTDIKKEWFHKNIDYFAFYGRDIETLLSKTKIAHSRRVFCKPIEEKTKIALKDLEKGFETYLKNENVKKRKDKKAN